jgi:hypothetical protein
MDKGKKGGKVKTITITKTPLATKLGGKNYYVVNRFCGRYLDNNASGNLFYNDESSERDQYQKWNFSSTDCPGVYNIKSIKTELYLSSNEIGDLNVSPAELESSYQKWIIMSTSEPECYVIMNSGNGFVLTCNKMDNLLMNILQESQYQDSQVNLLFKIFQYKAKK